MSIRSCLINKYFMITIFKRKGASSVYTLMSITTSKIVLLFVLKVASIESSSYMEKDKQ